MKIIIESHDVGREFNLTSMSHLLVELLSSVQSNARGPHITDTLSSKEPFIPTNNKPIKPKPLKKLKGETPTGAKVSIKPPLKRGRKPKVKPLPYSSDINPVTGEPYVKRGVIETIGAEKLMTTSLPKEIKDAL